MAEDRVRLELEAKRSTALLQGAQEPYLSLPVAAAIAFHHARGDTKAIVSRRDYDDALNLAAAALSRLVTIYASRGPLQVDLTKAQFVSGATELRSAQEALRELAVSRDELVSVLPLIKRAGLPF